ncbi:MAG: carbohydrate binding family 9 domain-containing protein [Saprospiraceae bacterium]|nr:carbohydrate binding family 9 domain-containing protein [Saprospiraceae bacterium]
MKHILTFLLALASGVLPAQMALPNPSPTPTLGLIARNEVPGKSPEGLRIQKADTPVQVDGLLDEAAWRNAQTAVDFSKNFPVDTGLAEARTEVLLSFDERNLYIAVVCWQDRADYTVPSLKRDFPNGTSDGVNILLSPSRDGLNGFFFSLNPLNVQREALVDNGTTLSFEWDNRWTSAVANYDDRWVAEVAIPFKTLRYTVAPGENIWSANFVRVRLKGWEVSTWRPVPRQYAANNLAFCHELRWDSPPPKPGASISLIPYANTRYDQDYRRDPTSLEVTGRPDRTKINLGGDAKIGITPSLNLDLTFNPDFSQVEVDRQVANLSRFELFFPERRQFFLENRDLFAMFGFPSTRPFFSRRIGLARNPVSGLTETVPIQAGARLSGKLNDDWRIGLLNMQTARVNWDSANVLPAANFTVATVQRKVFQRSAISAIVVNKENFTGSLSDEQRAGTQPWNRVAGLEYNLYSADNRWEGEWYYHRSFSPDPRKRGQTLANFLGYFDRNFNARMGYVLVDSFYNAEAGFVPRVGYQSFFPGVGLNFYPEKGAINSWSVGLEGDMTYSLKFKETDRDLAAYVTVNLKNQTYLNAVLINSYTYLFEDFDPTNLYREGTQPLPGGRGYQYNTIRLRFTSSSTYNLQGRVDTRFGQFFNGEAQYVEGELSYRLQPVGTFALSYSYNRIRLPEPYASADFWILGPRAELSFSRSLFVSAFLQWNTQANNFNINTRLQWRFAPVSDLFLVYTDNSFAEAVPNTAARFLSPKNRALVLKVVYWLNV